MVSKSYPFGNLLGVMMDLWSGLPRINHSSAGVGFLLSSRVGPGVIDYVLVTRDLSGCVLSGNRCIMFKSNEVLVFSSRAGLFSDGMAIPVFGLISKQKNRNEGILFYLYCFIYYIDYTIRNNILYTDKELITS